MTEGPYRDDLEAALRRAADLEEEVERLRQQLERATAARGLAVAADEQAREAEESALRIANGDLQRENAELRDRIRQRDARRPPSKVHPVHGVIAVLVVVIAQLVFWGVFAACSHR
jgi:hypothetical protein